MMKRGALLVCAALAAAVSALVAPGGRVPEARADDDMTAAAYLRDAQDLFNSGRYFESARYAFAASEQDPDLKPEAYARVSTGLVHAGLVNTAAYFFIRTLQTDNHVAIRHALVDTQQLLLADGADLLRPYLIKHTKYEDYDALNRSAYLFALAKTAILTEQEARAVQYLDAISPRSPIGPYALHLRGTAYAILGKDHSALDDFQACADHAQDLLIGVAQTASADRVRQVSRDADDLRARCIAGRARTLYQMDEFDEADRVYDSIPKGSLVWPDILFEQAWNSFGRREYNRTLGKLVSYKSPALGFVWNSEVDVLRAQAYLALCLYADANDVINEFNGKYEKLGESVKAMVEGNAENLGLFYRFGREALSDSLYTQNELHRLANRFVRGPYFQSLVVSEKALEIERQAIHGFAQMEQTKRGPHGGFPGFLDQVLSWRLRSIHLIGGAFVKNSLIDYHQGLIADFEKMSFIKLEMLRRAKDALVYKNRPPGDRSQGNVEPSRRDDQYYWTFNGEFWNDELGDYVFGLESECKGNEGA